MFGLSLHQKLNWNISTNKSEILSFLWADATDIYGDQMFNHNDFNDRLKVPYYAIYLTNVI